MFQRKMATSGMKRENRGVLFLASAVCKRAADFDLNLQVFTYITHYTMDTSIYRTLSAVSKSSPPILKTSPLFVKKKKKRETHNKKI